MFPDRKDRRCDTPPVFAALCKKLGVGEPLKIQTKVLVDRQRLAAPLFPRIDAFFLRGFIVRSVEGLHRSFELFPTSLLPGRKP
jgi:hypothetical protein